MDTYQQNFEPKPKKRSPYADAPYECAFVEPEVPEACPELKVREKREHRGWKTLLVLLIFAACCAGTAIGVTSIWQGRMERMEAAMDDKFAALEQLYKETNRLESTNVTAQGPLTPGQVFAKNVNAVVAVDALIETSEGYGESMGSGFIISADGYVVTNHHVIESATEVVLITHDGNVLEARIVGSDATNDIALLKVDGEDNLPFVTMGSSDALAVGDQVAAIGMPLGELTVSMTVGYISAKDRVINTDGTEINMLQTDAAINSGDSGGPLFNMNGEVVGIIAAKYSGNSNSGVAIEGLGFAIPVDDVDSILEDLQEFGYVAGAYLGVYVRDVDVSAQSYGLPAGVYVEETMADFSAERAGVRAGDIVVNLGGYDVTSVTELTQVLRRFNAGDTTSLTVYREGKMVYLKVTLDEKPVENQEPQIEEEPAMPSEGDYNEWFEFFAPFFGFDFD